MILNPGELLCTGACDIVLRTYQKISIVHCTFGSQDQLLLVSVRGVTGDLA